MEAQRIQSSMPDIVVNSIIEMVSTKEAESDLQEDMKMAEQENADIQRLFVNIYNVGLGVAKEIEFTWSYDIDELISIIKSIDDEYIAKTAMDNKIHIKKPFRSEGIYISKFDTFKEDKEFMIPLTYDGNYYKLEIPKDYLNIVAFLYESFTEAIIPSMQLEVKYVGIDGENYKDYYELVRTDEIMPIMDSHLEDNKFTDFMSRYKLKLK